jgi:hypothetical protein
MWTQHNKYRVVNNLRIDQNYIQHKASCHIPMWKWKSFTQWQYDTIRQKYDKKHSPRNLEIWGTWDRSTCEPMCIVWKANTSTNSVKKSILKGSDDDDILPGLHIVIDHLDLSQQVLYKFTSRCVSACQPSSVRLRLWFVNDCQFMICNISYIPLLLKFMSFKIVP